MRPQKVVFIYDLVVIESYDSATASLRWDFGFQSNAFLKLKSKQNRTKVC